ncbi:hypothetical protein P3T36_006519 [Kitasatospora sp. MAP12-15]|uniref:hypothetical protein n=1 Tax=unclassified Kitasatospora TaxID=2633591 RepID=UPI002473B54F|nr:hypothetical protein [Kitasatospora sp. MAP12-44]MDH6113156.1 hypothetical protein [Kitasatospora sp. MAP12-44]
MTTDRFAPPAPLAASSPDSRTSPAAAGHATPYRMTVTTRQPAADVVALADQCLAEFLKREGYDEPPPAPQPPPAGADQPAGDRHRLADRVLFDRDSGSLPAGPADAPGHYTRRRLRTPAPHGTHQLALTIASPAHGPTWVRLEAEHQAAAGVRTPPRVPVPELARTLLPLLDALDGETEVGLLPRIITAAEVDGVIDGLCDPARRLPTVIASVPADLDPEAWAAQVLHPLLRNVAGLAVGYVLAPDARVLFNTALEFHTVYGGAVRTYLPEVDPASRRDALRHLVLPRHRIESEPRRAAALLAREPRRLAELAPLPEPLAGVPPLRVRVAEPRPAEAQAAPPVGPDEPRLVRRSLPRSHRREFYLRAESEPQSGALRRVGGPLRGLSSRLCPPGQPAALLEGSPCGPRSFTELLHRIDEFPLLTFTGDAKETQALDASTAGSGWVRLTWDGLTALQEYAVAAVHGAAGGDFKQWCEHAPVGGSHFPPRKAVRGESQTVCSHAKMRRERMFVVPSGVDPSGRAFMGAHLRIGGGRTAPRLHYLDDCSGSGRIYVGYIGLHLTNTLTN